MKQHRTFPGGRCKKNTYRIGCYRSGEGQIYGGSGIP